MTEATRAMRLMPRNTTKATITATNMPKSSLKAWMCVSDVTEDTAASRLLLSIHWGVVNVAVTASVN